MASCRDWGSWGLPTSQLLPHSPQHPLLAEARPGIATSSPAQTPRTGWCGSVLVCGRRGPAGLQRETLAHPAAQTGKQAASFVLAPSRLPWDLVAPLTGQSAGPSGSCVPGSPPVGQAAPLTPWIIPAS
ncbi:unnamed protein product [Lepidochelys kempii]